MKILVPHDGSVTSDRALRKAISFARKLNYEIVLLYVLDLKMLPSDAILKNTQTGEELIKIKAKLLKSVKLSNQSMLKKRVELTKKRGLKTRFSIRVGSASEVILKFARAENVDFILMGSRGFPPSQRDKYERLRILGSVARKVSELSDRPVMIVK